MPKRTSSLVSISLGLAIAIVIALSTFVTTSAFAFSHSLAQANEGVLSISEAPLTTTTPTAQPSRTVTANVSRTASVLPSSTIGWMSPTTRPSNTPFSTPPPCSQAWNAITSPNPGNYNNSLYAVTTDSDGDVWAVGPGALIERWNGTSWQVMPTGNVTGTLEGVTMVSPTDGWAVGYTGAPDVMPRSMHWNGTSWSVVPMPDVNAYLVRLHDVAAVSATDVWAVGWIVPDGQVYSRELVMRWNGTAWSVVPTIGGAPEILATALYSVDVIAPNDVWAVGIVEEAGKKRTLTMHWNGAVWARVASPNVGNEDNILESVSAVGTDSVWAVGHYYDPAISFDRTLAMRWNGTQWSIVSTPDPAPGRPGAGSGNPNQDNPQSNFGTLLYGVDAVSETEVWAVGHIQPGWPNNRTMILRWNGTSWTHVPSPSPGVYVNQLYDVAAVGPGNVWAVGLIEDSSYYDLTLTMRYGPPCGTPGPTNTAQPSTTMTPATSTPPATSTLPATSTPLVTTTIIPTLTIVPTATGIIPTLTIVPTNTQSVTNTAIATGTSTATAVATVTACPGLNITGALTLNDPTQAGRLNTLFEASTCAAPRSCPGVLENVPRHYDAYAFRNTSSSEACFTVDVTAECLNNILIHSSAYLGSFDPNSLCQNYLADVGPGVLTNSQYSFIVPAGQTFVVVVNELAPNLLCPSYTLSVSGPACPVPTTPVPTSTSIIPTVTVQATLTVPPIPTTGPCSVGFSDVPSGNAFYQQIMCLSCMGFAGGYQDGTFRPNSEITRGQLSKLVSNTAGFSDAPTQQTFADVPEGSTFHMYVERMAQLGVIGGYPCGGPGEPCGVGNKPYFRPYANATRGQISKVVANAATLTDTPTGQAFEDVPSSHPFYQWVQRLAQHGMMSGYLCGGVGEPCGATNRPYFRPANNATRGQISKILGNGFYPGCEARQR